MIFHWVNHPDLRALDRFIMVLHELGMADRRHLGSVLGWKENTVRWAIREMRSRGSTPEEKDEWLSFKTPARGRRRNMYALGSQGIQYAQSIMMQRGSVREVSDGQWGHYLGLNNILVRLIESVGREKLKWYNTLEATDFLFRAMKMMKKEEWSKNSKQEREDRRKIIRPDALISIEDQMYWVEFDNDTEWTRQIENKMHDYVETLTSIQDPNPVVWITTSERRCNFLKDIWEYSRLNFDLVPKMYFFEEGQEVELFCPSSLTKL